MTLSDMLTAFTDFGGTASQTSDKTAWLDRALRYLARTAKTYTAQQFVRVADGTAYFDLAGLKPTAAESANGEAVGQLLRVQYQRGDSGVITGVSEYTEGGGSDALFASTAHGLSTGDIVQIHNTQDVIGTDAGATQLRYDGNDQTVTKIDDDSFITSKAWGVDATGVWIKEGYRRWDLHPMDRYEVERSFTQPTNPTDSEAPEGVLILTWEMVPPSLNYLSSDSVELPDWILQNQHHDTLVWMAASMNRNKGQGIFLQSQNYANYRAFEPQLTGMVDDIVNDYAMSVPQQPSRYGKFRYDFGIYNYEPRAGEALVFNARNCW